MWWPTYKNGVHLLKSKYANTIKSSFQTTKLWSWAQNYLQDIAKNLDIIHECLVVVLRCFKLVSYKIEYEKHAKKFRLHASGRTKGKKPHRVSWEICRQCTKERRRSTSFFLIHTKETPLAGSLCTRPPPTALCKKGTADVLNRTALARIGRKSYLPGLSWPIQS